MKASPIPLSLERLPLPLLPPLLRREATAVDLDPLLLPPAERLLLVVFLAIARLSSCSGLKSLTHPRTAVSAGREPLERRSVLTQ
jgi:hypothetical protein